MKKKILAIVIVVILIICAVFYLKNRAGGTLSLRSVDETEDLELSYEEDTVTLDDGSIVSLNEYRSNQESDIEGYSVQDKIDAGLLSFDGSDTDGDGLTDKEEVEVYNSDPLKASTAGDMYLDSEKVELGLDINSKIDRDGKAVYTYKNNTADNITLTNPASAECVNARVAENWALEGQIKTGINTYPNFYSNTFYAAYTISGFGGTVTIDLSDIISINDISIEDIDLVEFDKANDKAVEIKHEIDGTSIVFDTDKDKVYEVYLINKKNTKADEANDSLSFIDKILGNENYAGQFIIEKPYQEWKWSSDEYVYNIYYVTTGNEKVDDEIIAYAKALTDIPTCKTVKELSNTVFASKLRSFQNKTITIDEWESSDDGFQDTITAFTKAVNRIPLNNEDSNYLADWYSSTDIVNYAYNSYSTGADVTGVVASNHTGFTSEDAIPFSNFGSYISPGGNCMGFAMATAQVFNSGSVNESGAATLSDGSSYSYDATKYEQNLTFLNKGLSDYAGSLSDNSNTMSAESLSDDERELVNMLGVMWSNGNSDYTAEYSNYYTLINTSESSTTLSYRLITEMVNYLNQGKILTITLGHYDSNGNWLNGHAINIIDYTVEGETVYFFTYDNNHPDQVGQKAIIVNKVLNDDGTIGFGAYYEFSPSTHTDTINDEFYKFTVLDENHNNFTESYGLSNSFTEDEFNNFINNNQ